LHVPAGEQRQRRGAVAGVVAEAVGAWVSRVQVLVEKVALQFEQELRRQGGVRRVEARVEDADPRAVTGGGPDERPG
jgi:hypothetical protein